MDCVKNAEILHADRTFQKVNQLIELYLSWVRLGKVGVIQVSFPNDPYKIGYPDLGRNANDTLHFAAQMCQRNGKKHGIKVLIEIEEPQLASV